jgi:hypothetical protein
MSSALSVVVIIAVLLVMAVTNPNEQAHRNAQASAIGSIENVFLGTQQSTRSYQNMLIFSIMETKMVVSEPITLPDVLAFFGELFGNGPSNAEPIKDYQYTIRSFGLLNNVKVWKEDPERH